MGDGIDLPACLSNPSTRTTNPPKTPLSSNKSPNTHAHTKPHTTPTHTPQVPVYENMALSVGIKSTPLGGGDLTAYLASMLESCTTDPYSAQTARRRLDIARAVKERHAYVAGDFEAEVRLC
jgi:hypothetical protein